MVRHLSSRPHGPTRTSGRPHAVGVASALLFAVIAAQSGCDNNAEFTPLVLTFKEVQLVSTVPATKAIDGTWEPLCGLEIDNTNGEAMLPDGILVNTLFVSNSRNDGSSSYDKDQSLRPGDRVNFRNIVDSHTTTRIGDTDIDLADASLYVPEITCLEPLPDTQSPANDSDDDDFRCVEATCTPACEGSQCGPDGCGGHCGVADARPGATGCEPGFECDSRQCVECAPISNNPATGAPYASRCEELGRECGWDGCGGYCGTGTNQESPLIGGCSHSGTGRCTGDPSVRCYVDAVFSFDACAGLGVCSATCATNDSQLCGSDDDCNGICQQPKIVLRRCSDEGQCEGTKDKPCIPDCTDKVCGDDGCGGECGNTCPAGQTCMVKDNCDGLRVGQVALSRVDYRSFSNARKEAHNVLVLIDRSGSMSGIVEPGTFKEANEPAIGAGSFGQNGSDAYRYRDVAVTKFIKRLNTRDNVGVIAFGEGIPGADSMVAPCQNPDASTGTVEGDLDVCFRAMGASGSNNGENNWIEPDCSGQLMCASHQCQRAGNCSTNGSQCTKDTDCTKCSGGTCLHDSTIACVTDQDCGSCNGVPELYNPGDSWKCGGLSGNLDAGKGRSNLWSAVDKAYGYLSGDFHDQDSNTALPSGPKSLRDKDQSKHIVVVTDGPDTCDTGSETYASCQTDGACGTARLDDVIARIKADIADPNEEPIAVHFVQFESLGYRGRDPRQVQVSCLTGGHYQFINSEDLSKTNVASFEQALDQALLNVRYSLMGYWQLAHQVAALGDNTATASGGTPSGSLYGFSGVLTVLEKSNLISEKAKKRTVVQAYGIGLGKGAYESKRWDRRPGLAKPCMIATECAFQGGTPGTESDCHIVCSPETNLCPGKAEGVNARNLASCTEDGSGTAGVCCNGSCNITQQCIECLN